MRIYVVSEPGWEGAVDSVWSTEELAHARADAIDPHPDKDGVKWGIISEVELDTDPDDDDYFVNVERRS